eukprot:CAMPEP_0172176730 /NCGR_PEP_ID=MMETSP1050-20130122/14998_1 /TAXON_ID=233186 /ORGANISM="Cryptomonas curvata, Strain CCAP979/52" /LENGTH=51 /DNA_ID=CAMNT_0012849081 /DNA_START=40 /DNA_END=192 /DNA_ORIENTATION=+
MGILAILASWRHPPRTGSSLTITVASAWPYHRGGARITAYFALPPVTAARR